MGPSAPHLFILPVLTLGSVPRGCRAAVGEGSLSQAVLHPCSSPKCTAWSLYFLGCCKRVIGRHITGRWGWPGQPLLSALLPRGGEGASLWAGAEPVLHPAIRAFAGFGPKRGVMRRGRGVRAGLSGELAAPRAAVCGRTPACEPSLGLGLLLGKRRQLA